MWFLQFQWATDSRTMLSNLTPVCTEGHPWCWLYKRKVLRGYKKDCDGGWCVLTSIWWPSFVHEMTVSGYGAAATTHCNVTLFPCTSLLLAGPCVILGATTTHSHMSVYSLIIDMTYYIQTYVDIVYRIYIYIFAYIHSSVPTSKNINGGDLRLNCLIHSTLQ